MELCNTAPRAKASQMLQLLKEHHQSNTSVNISGGSLPASTGTGKEPGGQCRNTHLVLPCPRVVLQGPVHPSMLLWHVVGCLSLLTWSFLQTKAVK